MQILKVNTAAWFLGITVTQNNVKDNPEEETVGTVMLKSINLHTEKYFLPLMRRDFEITGESPEHIRVAVSVHLPHKPDDIVDDIGYKELYKYIQG